MKLAPLFVAALVLGATPTPVEHAYGATPEAAAVSAFSYPSPPRAAKITVVGRFATVALAGARLEGEPLRDALVLERFPFGWQPVALGGIRCSLAKRGVSARAAAALAKGMPDGGGPRACDASATDRGPAEDVAAVRRRMHGAIVARVVVSGDYALGSWYAPGGGMAIFKRVNGRWTTVVNGGGALDLRGLHEYGVPDAALPGLRPFFADA